MVRALITGDKTQTRRVAPITDLNIKPHSDDMVTWGVSFSKPIKGVLGSYSGGRFSEDQACSIIASQFCPYGQPGDRLWVRETWGVVSNTWDEDGERADWTPNRPAKEIREMRFGQGYYSGHAIYAADGSFLWAGDDDGGGEPRSAWHPSIHMPRAASRILLEITAVRAERLQDISEADARSEGARECDPVSGREVLLAGPNQRGSFILHYRDIWEQINGAGSWAENPFVWVIEFRNIAGEVP
jgi:hypothetical protein